MNSEEYQEIIQFLREQKYPEAALLTASEMELQKELSSYFIAESGTLFKVIFLVNPENLTNK